MGYAKTPLNPPTEYLKKGSKSKSPVNAIKQQPFKYPVSANLIMWVHNLAFCIFSIGYNLSQYKNCPDNNFFQIF